MSPRPVVHEPSNTTFVPTESFVGRSGRRYLAVEPASPKGAGPDVVCEEDCVPLERGKAPGREKR